MRAASREFVGKRCDLERLGDALEEYFQLGGFETQSTKGEDGWILQARKTGVVRGLLAADRAFTITITGEPEDFRVSMGIGKWMQNIGMAIVEGIAFAPVVFFVEVPISLWSYEIEREFWNFVEKQVELRV